MLVALTVAAAALTAPRLDDAHPEWSHDGRFVAFDRTRRLGDGSTNASIVVVRRDGRGLHEITPTTVPFDAVRPVWSDDGDWLAFNVGSDVLPTTVQWERRDGRSANSLLTGGGLITTAAPPSWSRNGHRLALAGSLGGSNGVYVVGRDTSRVRRVVAGDALFVAWSPDGHRIAYADSRSLALVVPGRSGVTRLRAPPARLAWSLDGTRVAYAAGCAVGIVSADAAGRPPALAPCPPDVESSTPSWSPDGRRIAYSVCRRPVCSVFVASATGTTSGGIQITGARDPAWSPDGRLIAYTRVAGSTATRIYLVRPNGTHARPLLR
jgi:Tol biopolymer transport system component